MLKAFRFPPLKKKKSDKQDGPSEGDGDGDDHGQRREPSPEPEPVLNTRVPGDLCVLVKKSTEEEGPQWYLESRDRGLSAFKWSPLDRETELTTEERTTLHNIPVTRFGETQVVNNCYVFGRCPPATCIGILKEWLTEGPKDMFFENLRENEEDEDEAYRNIVWFYDEPWTYSF